MSNYTAALAAQKCDANYIYFQNTLSQEQVKLAIHRIVRTLSQRGTRPSLNASYMLPPMLFRYSMFLKTEEYYEPLLYSAAKAIADMEDPYYKVRGEGRGAGKQQANFSFATSVQETNVAP